MPVTFLRVAGTASTTMMATAMTARPISTSAPGAILNLLSPEPVSTPSTIRSSTVVTTFTSCDTVTEAAMVPSSTFCLCR